MLILGVPEAIRGGMTTTEYAEKHNIPLSTLKSWILGNETVEEARGLMLAYELALKTVEIDSAKDALALARAREGFRAWSWIAERRESRLYGARQEVHHTGTVTVSNALQAISERRLAGGLPVKEEPALIENATGKLVEEDAAMRESES